MHTISAIKELGVGNFGLNRSGLNTEYKKGQKREIEEYCTFELVIAFLYLVAAKGAICLSGYSAVGNCCLLGD